MVREKISKKIVDPVFVASIGYYESENTSPIYYSLVFPLIMYLKVNIRDIGMNSIGGSISVNGELA